MHTKCCSNVGGACCGAGGGQGSLLDERYTIPRKRIDRERYDIERRQPYTNKILCNNRLLRSLLPINTEATMYAWRFLSKRTEQGI
jgi:hypothetical protein